MKVPYNSGPVDILVLGRGRTSITPRAGNRKVERARSRYAEKVAMRKEMLAERSSMVNKSSA
jgi:hypothetical protein